MRALEGLVRALAQVTAERQSMVAAELLEHIAHEVRVGNATAATVRFALAPQAAWARVDVRWADGWFHVFEVGRDSARR